MKFVCPYFDDVILFKEQETCTIVVENKTAFRTLVEDLHAQIEEGIGGKCLLSENEKPLSMAKCCDLLQTFAPFDMNRKKLIGGIVSHMEAKAADECFFSRTQALLSSVEQFVDALGEELPCTVACGKLNISALLKAIGIEIIDDYDNAAEKILDYMQLIQDFCHVKLFITVNMRSFFDTATMQLFIDTAMAHNISLLMLESAAFPRLQGEKRITVDEDLCVF